MFTRKQCEDLRDIGYPQNTNNPFSDNQYYAEVPTTESLFSYCMERGVKKWGSKFSLTIDYWPNRVDTNIQIKLDRKTVFYSATLPLDDALYYVCMYIAEKD